MDAGSFSYGHRIKTLRQAAGLTQGQLGQRLGISTQVMSMYENGREPPYEILCNIAKIFGVSTDYLLGLSPYQSVAHSESIDKTFEKLSSNVQKQCVEVQLALLKVADAFRWAGESEPVFPELLHYLIDDLKQCIEAYLRQLDYNTPETNWETDPNYFADLFIHDRANLFKNVSAVTDLIYRRGNIEADTLLRNKPKATEWE